MPDIGKTLVSVATYNEMENLPRLVDEVFQYAPDVDMLVVDDGSPDGTGQWVDQQATVDPRLHCLHRAGKLGLGTAIIAGMRYAIDHGYRYVVSMDADFSHHPKYLAPLIAGMDADDSHVDVMIGSRYVSGGGVEGWPLKRHFMSRAINVYSRWLLWMDTRDCSGGFRCYRTSRLANLDFGALKSHGYSFQEEVLWRLKKQGCRVAETPITFVDRVRGQSKIDGGEARAALTVIAGLGFRNLFHR